MSLTTFIWEGSLEKEGEIGCLFVEMIFFFFFFFFFLSCSSVNDAANLEMLRDTLQITHVVSCVLGLRPLYPGIFKYLIVPLRDVADEPLEPYFESTIHFIDSALAGGGRVFVHCMKG